MALYTLCPSNVAFFCYPVVWLPRYVLAQLVFGGRVLNAAILANKSTDDATLSTMGSGSPLTPVLPAEML